MFFDKIRNPDLRDFFTSLFGKKDVADGTIAGNRLVEIDSSGDLIEGTVNSQTIVGVNAEGSSKTSTKGIEIVSVGVVEVISATKIVAGKKLKCADNGRVTELCTNANSGVTIDTGTGVAFTNQPTNDGVEVVSDDAGDTTQTVTVIGITGETVTVEDIELNGTTPVASSKTDFDEILAVKLDASCDGTVTVREASGDLAITTITTGNLNSGVVEVPAADQNAFNIAPTIVADDATTKMIGIQYTQNDGSTVAYQADQLAGTVAQTFGTVALKVTELYVGDLEAARTVTIKTGAEEDENNCIGKAYEAASTADTKFKAILNL